MIWQVLSWRLEGLTCWIVGTAWITQTGLNSCVFVFSASVNLDQNHCKTIKKDKLREIKSQLRLRSWRGLSLFGNATIIKSFLLPKVLYVSSIFPSPLEFIKAFQSIIYNFLWKGPDKIARPAVINDFKFGGLKVTDLTTSIMSLQISWIGRFLSDDFYPWKACLLHLLKPFGGKFFVHCDFNIYQLLNEAE